MSVGISNSNSYQYNTIASRIPAALPECSLFAVPRSLSLCVRKLHYPAEEEDDEEKQEKPKTRKTKKKNDEDIQKDTLVLFVILVLGVIRELLFLVLLPVFLVLQANQYESND